jgi:hypothetical protein
MLNFIFLLLFFISTPSEQKNDWQKSNLRGSPEKVVTMKEKSLPVIEIYNKSGFIIHKKNECFCGCPRDKECTIDFVYSEDNKLIETTTVVENKVIEKIAFSYKPNGEEVRKYIIGSQNQDAMIISGYGIETKSEYDKYNNLKEEIRTDTETSEKEITTYKFTYDKKGNWIVKEISKKDFKENDFHKGDIIKREITYF